MEIVHTSEFDSPIGSLRVASTAKGLAFLALPHSDGRGLAGWLRRHAPDATVREGFAPNRNAIAQVLEYLEGKRKEFELSLDLRGTPFQVRVWEQLLKIPYGDTLSYSQLANRAGRPNAVRAAGSANGANPVPLVVPCHRVIAANGGIGGFGGGIDLKKRLLALEHTAPRDGDLL